jgi:hypothetical protein
VQRRNHNYYPSQAIKVNSNSDKMYSYSEPVPFSLLLCSSLPNLQTSLTIRQTQREGLYTEYLLSTPDNHQRKEEGREGKKEGGKREGVRKGRRKEKLRDYHSQEVPQKTLLNVMCLLNGIPE